MKQLCLGIVLKESKLKSANKLALRNIDQAARAALDLYSSQHELETSTSDVFASVLPKVAEQNLIIKSDEKAIMKCHKISDETSFSNSEVETRLVDEYITLVKILLAYFALLPSKQSRVGRDGKEYEKSIMTENHISSTFDLRKCHYCPDCDELLCILKSDKKENIRGWCGNCKLVWLLNEN